MPALRRWQTWAFSFLCWTAYALLDSSGSFAILISYAAKPAIPHVLIWNFATAFFWATLTPLIYAVADRYPLRYNSWGKPLAVHFGIALIASLAGSWLLIHLNRYMGREDTSSPFSARLIELTFELVPRSFVAVAATQALAFYGKLRQRERESSQLEAELARAQLEILRSQLEPHFLFNTLNSIAALTRSDPASAERMTIKLAALLRGSLDCADVQEIPLEQELRFLDDYLAIQQARFRDRLTIDINVDRRLLPVPVPSLMLQPLVENAIRHGLAKAAVTGCIAIHVFREDGYLKIKIVDNGVGITNEELTHEGVGLRNTRARLECLYGGHQCFQIEGASGTGCRVTVAVPLQPQWNNQAG